MAGQNTAPAGSRYQDQRHYLVAVDLDDLRGPTRGVVTLDRRLDWSADARYDLDDPGDLLVMYQTVLNEASTLEDLSCWIDADTLRHLWPSLWLPSRLRALWEARFPELAGRPRWAAS